MLRRLELDAAAPDRLAAQCLAHGIEFVSTPFDSESAELLVRRVGVKRLKVSSGDLTNGPLLLRLAASGLPVILSTGMATLDEVAEALGALAFGYLAAGKLPPSRDAFARSLGSEAGRAALAARVTLLHCTTAYPTAFADVNLRAMDTLAETFGLPVGYADHTTGITVAIAATAHGARVIEKHFTLSQIGRAHV